MCLGLNAAEQIIIHLVNRQNDCSRIACSQIDCSQITNTLKTGITHNRFILLIIYKNTVKKQNK